MTTATVTSKGQVTIPLDVRTAMGIAAGDKLDFIRMKDGNFAVVPVTGSVKALEGIIPKPAKRLSLEEMDEAITRAVLGK